MMKIFLLSGKARSGKGEVAKIIKEYYGEKCIEMMFAKTIKQYAKDYMGWDGADETKPREFLQTIGTDVIRNKLNNPNFHLNRVLEDIEILKHYFSYFIVSDCRFPNECDIPKEKYGNDVVLIRINREFTNLTDSQQQHESEIALDNYKKWDYQVDNNGSLADLQNKLLKIIEPIENMGDDNNDPIISPDEMEY